MKENPNIRFKGINALYDHYLGKERGIVPRPGNTAYNAVIVFPNDYNIGMANLGFLRAYELLNKSGFISADRAFLQKDTSRGIISLESRKKISSYDLIFFSLSYENDFYNILSILETEKIPFLSEQRDSSFPLIIAGGVIGFLNPEPVAPIFDLILAGEAESIFPDFFSCLLTFEPGKLRKNKQEIVEYSGKLKGIYAPSHYEFAFDKNNVLQEIKPDPGFPEKIKRVWAPANSAFSSSVITTEFSRLSNINMIEVARGCKRGCRFCSAGFIYLPLRSSNPETVIKYIDSLGENEKAGFVGFDTLDNDNIGKYMSYSRDTGKGFSLSSIRLDCLDEKNLGIISDTGLKTVTIGIETGSERLKKLINKDISNEEIISVIERIVDHGIINIKAYFMIGLPLEEETDLDETISLVNSMRDIFISSSKKKGRIGNLTVSFSPFVPKAWTPLQWENFENPHGLRKKINYISGKLKHLPNIDIRYNPVKSAYVEAFLARGSRRSLDILIHSYKNKINLDKAVLNLNLKMNEFIRKFDTGELLPWDIIEQGVSKKYLLEEYRRGLDFKLTPQCFEGCKRCGVC